MRVKSEQQPQLEPSHRSIAIRGVDLQVTTAVEGTNNQVCPAENCDFRGSIKAIRDHATARHIPALFDERSIVGSRRSNRRLQALNELARRLTGSAKVRFLVSYWNREGLTALGQMPMEGMVDLCRAASWPIPPTFRTQPMNSPACLIQWSVLTRLVGRLKVEEQTAFIEKFPATSRARLNRNRRKKIGKRQEAADMSTPSASCVGDEQAEEVPMEVDRQEEQEVPSEDVAKTTNGAPAAAQLLTDFSEAELDYTGTPSPEKRVRSPSPGEEERLLRSPPRSSQGSSDMSFLSPFTVYDSHFHLDRLASKKNWTWEETIGRLSLPLGAPPAHPVILSGGTMVFCDPPMYDKLPFRAAGFASAVGIHPRRIQEFTEKRALQLKNILAQDWVAGLGEVGLDRVEPPQTWPVQEKILKRVLGWCEPRHTLVLHLRGRSADKTSGEVLDRGLEIVRDACPKEQRIHLHCFTGTKREVKKWLAAFPNCYFGYTGMVGRFTRQQKEGLMRVPANRLLLETDSPYLAPVTNVEINTPAYLGEVAHLVAQVRQEAVSVVIAATYANARHIYCQAEK